MSVTRRHDGDRHAWRGGVTRAIALFALVGLGLWLYRVDRHRSRRAANDDAPIGEAPGRRMPARTQSNAIVGEPPPAAAQDPRAMDRSGLRAGQVAGAGGSADGLRRLPLEITSRLTEEERNVLREHRPEEVGQMIALAHSRYSAARSAERPEAEQRLRMLLDLWLKIHPQDSPERSVELLKREQQYFRDVPAEWSRLFHMPLSQEERQRKLDEFKREYFSRFPD